MTYSNMDNVPTQTAGTSELLASDWNTYVRDNFDSIKFGHVVCTSSTRPTGIGEGTMIYETDTNKVYVYNGSTWTEVHDLDNTGSLPDGGAALSVLGNGTNATAARTDLTAGTDGHVLRRSGTSLGFGTIDASVNKLGLVHIKTVNFSSSTSVQVTSAFSSTYTTYRIVVEENSNNNGTVSIQLAIGSGSAVGGTAYSYTGVVTDGATGPSLSRSTGTDRVPIGNHTATVCTYSVDVARPNIADATAFTSIGAGSNQYYLSHSGNMSTATAYDSFYIVSNSGTMTGNVRVYGYLNS